VLDTKATIGGGLSRPYGESLPFILKEVKELRKESSVIKKVGGRANTDKGGKRAGSREKDFSL